MVEVSAITRDAIDLHIETLLNSLFLATDLVRMSMESPDPRKQWDMLAHLLKSIEKCATDLQDSVHPDSGKAVTVQSANDTNKYPWVKCPENDGFARPVHGCVYCPHFLHLSKKQAVVFCAFDTDGDA